MVDLADRLGKERFSVVGHDWGGVVAWMTAIAHPERVERLVAINAPHPAVFRRELKESFAQKRASAYMLAFRVPGFARVLTARGCAVLERIVLRRGLEEGWLTEADREAYLAAWSRPGAIEAGLKWYRASSSRSAGGERDWTVRVPTLVVWGMRDRYLRPGCLEGLEAYVPDLEVRRVADADHWIVHQKPDLVSGAIRGFLER